MGDLSLYDLHYASHIVACAWGQNVRPSRNWRWQLRSRWRRSCRLGGLDLCDLRCASRIVACTLRRNARRYVSSFRRLGTRCNFGALYKIARHFLQYRGISDILGDDGRERIYRQRLAIIAGAQIKAAELIVDHTKCVQHSNVIGFHLPCGLQVIECARVVTIGDGTHSGLIVVVIFADGND